MNIGTHDVFQRRVHSVPTGPLRGGCTRVDTTTSGSDHTDDAESSPESPPLLPDSGCLSGFAYIVPASLCYALIWRDARVNTLALIWSAQSRCPVAVTSSVSQRGPQTTVAHVSFKMSLGRHGCPGALTLCQWFRI